MGVPWRLRGYAVERLLGSGASGDVWRARVTGSGEPVALKRIFGADAEQVRRAETEAALLTVLDHPHLVRLHALVPTADATVLVLDLADGGSLAELLAARGRLAPGEVITAIAPIGAALAYLHDEGVVHGDVSAANILFSRAGSTLLADVGVARLTGDDSQAHSTPAYVDPAVAAGCVPGPASDVFMLAAVALHALTGAPPWPGSADEALDAAAGGVLDDVADRLDAAGVAPAMAAVLCRALALDPHRRGTAADLALDLRHSGQPVAVELAAGRVRDEPVATPRSGPRHAAVPGSAADRMKPADRMAPADRIAAGRAGSTVDTDPARPAFERPSPPGSVSARMAAQPPTRMVGPRPRPVIPRPPRRSARRRTLGLSLVAVLAALVAAAGTVWASTRSGSGHAASGHAASGHAGSGLAGSGLAASPPAVRPVSRPTATPASPATTSVTAAPSRARSPQAVLQSLDAVRARAFAERNARLLMSVYVPGPLLAADTALLRRLVPAGCGLYGVRTRYEGVRATATPGRLAVTTTATLPASQLICGGVSHGMANGTGAVTLHLVLRSTPDGPRIAEQVVR